MNWSNDSGLVDQADEHWKFDPNYLVEREPWDDYQSAMRT